MLTAQTVALASAQVLHKVFGVTALHIHHSLHEKIEFMGREAPIASLNFAGDCSGFLLMALDVHDVPTVVDMVLARYAIDIPVEDHIVFAEMLNIYAANLVTELQASCANFSIASPDARWLGPLLIEEGQKVLRVHMQAEGDLEFCVFYSYHIEVLPT